MASLPFPIAQLLPALAALAALAPPALAQMAEHPRDRFWILWERRIPLDPDCIAEERCQFSRRFTSRMFSPGDTALVERLFGILDSRALDDGRLADAADAPRICQHDSPQALLGFDPAALPVARGPAVLRGIDAIGLDLTGLAAPPGQPETFGQDIHAAFARRLEAAGLSVVSPKEAETQPGRPSLKLFFSFTDPDGACEYTYSYFSTLTQTALLARDPHVKVEVGVWSHMNKSVGRDMAGREAELILGAADALARDWQEANGLR